MLLKLESPISVLGITSMLNGGTLVANVPIHSSVPHTALILHTIVGMSSGVLITGVDSAQTTSLISNSVQLANVGSISGIKGEFVDNILHCKPDDGLVSGFGLDLIASLGVMEVNLNFKIVNFAHFAFATASGYSRSPETLRVIGSVIEALQFMVMEVFATVETSADIGIVSSDVEPGMSFSLTSLVVQFFLCEMLHIGTVAHSVVVTLASGPNFGGQDLDPLGSQ